MIRRRCSASVSANSKSKRTASGSKLKMSSKRQELSFSWRSSFLHLAFFSMKKTGFTTHASPSARMSVFEPSHDVMDAPLAVAARSKNATPEKLLDNVKGRVQVRASIDGLSRWLPIKRVVESRGHKKVSVKVLHSTSSEKVVGRRSGGISEGLRITSGPSPATSCCNAIERMAGRQRELDAERRAKTDGCAS